ncbi:MAG: ferritin [Gammaproteobacteria bacterium]|nr:ferritin [Gammaproteobacteria bacterium]
MGTTARDMIGVDANELIALLNKALADEWLAYYQYWIGAKILRGPLRSAVAAELIEHAADELRHAEMLAVRIMQLGGTPLLSPLAFEKESNCGYLEPIDPNVAAILKQGIEGERCAIAVYKKLLEFTKDKDELTYNMALEILNDEIDHEDDFEVLLEDMGI